MAKSRLLKIQWLFLILVFSIQTAFLQCPQGAIGATGAGCGCLSGCNLTSFGGPNCTGTTGNCSAGYIPLSVDIPVPDGCTFTVTALMANRPGCSASGADGSCTTCDRLKVDIPGGTKPVQIGGGNASITDNYTLVGPGTIRVSGGANRADEIITYSTVFSGAFCEACGSILPVELLSFSAVQDNDFVRLAWSTGSELNNDYFILERSADGINFEMFAQINGIGNSNSKTDYTFYDSSPLFAKNNYYRLSQVDLDGTMNTTRKTSVAMDHSLVHLVNGELVINLRKLQAEVTFAVFYSADGKQVAKHQIINNFLTIPWSQQGLWIIHFPEIGWTERIYTF